MIGRIKILFINIVYWKISCPSGWEIHTLKVRHDNFDMMLFVLWQCWCRKLLYLNFSFNYEGKFKSSILIEMFQTILILLLKYMEIYLFTWLHVFGDTILSFLYNACYQTATSIKLSLSQPHGAFCNEVSR